MDGLTVDTAAADTKPPKTDPPKNPPPPAGPKTPPPPAGPKTNDAVAPGWVDEKIAAAVAAAPPLPDDVAVRLVELIRTTPPVACEGAVRILARRPAPASHGAAA